MSDDEYAQAQSSSNTNNEVNTSQSFANSKSQSVAFRKRCTENSVIEQTFKTSKLADERKTAHELMLEECTFEPSTKGLPRSYGPNKTAGTLVYNRLTKWEKSREAELKQKKVIRAHEEVKDCTFKPQINKTGHKVVHDKPVNVRLYEESSLIAANKAKFAEELRAKEIEKQTEECTFKPRLSTRRTAWAKVEPKYNQTHEFMEKHEPEKENFTYTPQVNDIPKDMLSARMYTTRDVVDRLTGHVTKSSVQKPRIHKERTIIDVSTFLAGPQEIEECLKASSRNEDISQLVDGPAGNSNKESNILGGLNQWRPAPTSKDQKSREGKFQEFLSRQHGAEQRKKLQIAELEKSLLPNSKFEVNEESKKIISKSQRGEFMERLQHDVELRKDRKTIIPEEYSFKPTLHKSLVNRESKGKKKVEDSTQVMKEQVEDKPPALPLAPSLKKKVHTTPDQASHSEGLNMDNKISIRTRTSQRIPPPPPPSEQSLHQSERRKKKSAKPPADLSKYIQQHERLLEKRREMQEQGLVKKAEKELEDCTFTPQIKECPKFVSNIARSISVVKSVKTSRGPTPQEGWR